jgi:hypothetical protein
MERYWRTQWVIFRLLFAGWESERFGLEYPLKMLILHRVKHLWKPQKSALSMIEYRYTQG